MELTADRRRSARSVASAKRAFTRSWQSSKVPSTARLWTLGESTVVICRRWISLTRPWGCSITISMPARPLVDSMAADPVSPEVAPMIVTRSPRRSISRSNSGPTSCRATSLNARVGPWKSSSSQRPAPRSRRGVMSGWSKEA